MPILNKKNKKQVEKYNKFVREYMGSSMGKSKIKLDSRGSIFRRKR